MPGDLTRKEFLQRSGLAALGIAGVYGLLDGLATAPARAAVARVALPPEQHLMQGLRVITDDGVRVTVPPLYHHVVTAQLDVARTPKALRDARLALERALAEIEARHPPTPAGLTVVVGWGTPYFREYVPAVHGTRYPAYLPVDREASQTAGAPVPAFFDVERFPSDPSTLVLERNDVCFVFQSDSLERIATESQALFSALDGLLRLTSIRKGFVGGGFGGRTSLPKEMATKAKIAGADQIPRSAQLFLGFTSTQKAALGPDRIANFETLPGMTDQWPNGYFRNGTTMHVSHLYEDVAVWYSNNAFALRVWLATDLGRSSNTIGEDVLTLPEGPGDVQTEQLVAQFATDPENGLVGHSASIQPVNRLQAAVRDNYGVLRPKGTAILQRVDFNTLDHPFFWSASPTRDRFRDSEPAAGVHFIAFSPTTDFFRRMRLAMDGRYADGTVLPVAPHSAQMGLNGVLHTTHRQHYLVPPRRHRSFPLSELL
ncbi:MAG TPA: hypothetical protein VHC45_14590 [Gaiellaceae bacterium]|nr:hypothetical protein [Gaiellaceae bacterium]